MTPVKRKSRAGRPRREDRDAVRSQLVTLKLTPRETVLLDNVLELRRQELAARSGGARVVLTRSSVLRELLEAEGRRRRLRT